MSFLHVTKNALKFSGTDQPILHHLNVGLEMCPCDCAFMQAQDGLKGGFGKMATLCSPFIIKTQCLGNMVLSNADDFQSRNTALLKATAR